MKRLEISVARIVEVFEYDALSGKFFRKIPTDDGFQRGPEAGYTNRIGYRQLSVDGVNIRCHRAAWAIHYGVWPTLDIDHINRDKADNRIENLRETTIGQNQANTVRPNVTGRKGVRMNKRRYQAQIKHQGKFNHLGTFGTLDEAAHAYNKAAIRLHGEFALLNPIGQHKAIPRIDGDKQGAQGGGNA